VTARLFSPRLVSSSLVLISCIAVLGCGSLPGRPKPGPEVPRPDSIVDFATLYRENCSACHGAKGMNGPSYPLANPKYQALVDEQGLHQVVANGEPGTLMPAFAISAGGSLTDEQVDALVHGMRGAWHKPGTLDGVNAPPYRAARTGDAAHGQQAYGTYCAGCHGAAGQAGKSKAGSIMDPAFLSLVSDQVLRTIIVAGRPDIGQPDWRNDLPGHPMSDQEVTDVVAWLSSQRPGAPPANQQESVAPKKGGGGLP
jgi:cytochrome c oxidase cbb3-type subunit III